MPDLLPLFLTAFLYAGLGAYFWRALWLGKRHRHNTPCMGKACHSAATAAPCMAAAATDHPAGRNQARCRARHLGHRLAHGSGLLAGQPAQQSGRPAGICAALRRTQSGRPLDSFPPPIPCCIPKQTLFKIHLFIATLAYSLFTIAAMHALLMAAVERHLHSRPLSTLLQRLPPLLTMEHLLFRILWAGFTLLTLTLMSGMLFSEELFGKALQLSHKTVFAHDLLGHLCRSAGGSPALWLARTHCHTLDTERIHGAVCWLISAASSCSKSFLVVE